VLDEALMSRTDSLPSDEDSLLSPLHRAATPGGVGVDLSVVEARDDLLLFHL